MSPSSLPWRILRWCLLSAGLVAVIWISVGILLKEGSEAMAPALAMLFISGLLMGVAYLCARILMAFRSMVRRTIDFYLGPRPVLLRWPLFRIFMGGTALVMIVQFCTRENRATWESHQWCLILGWLLGTMDVLKDRARTAAIERGAQGGA